MELFIILFYAGVFFAFWLIIRFFGWLFRGPRYRQRQMHKYARQDAKRAEHAFLKMYEERRKKGLV